MDLRLTKENILEMLDKNILERNTEVIEFVQMLDKCKGARIFAINGMWGCGKSFFIRQACEILDYDYRKKRDISSEGNKDFKRIDEIIKNHKELQIETLNRCFVTIYYDAWLHDDHEDPLLSLIYEIESKYKELFSEKTETDSAFYDTFEVLKSWIEKKRGLRSVAEAEKMKEDFRKLLAVLYEEKLGQEKDGRVLIIIDELDRCKPDYAVKVLERIKHFVDLENVFFVYCLNKVELCKTIECYYGRDLESTMYLNKFFDITYDLNIKDVHSYYYQILMEFPNHPRINSVIPGLAQYMNFSLRECNQLKEVIKGRLSIEEADNEETLIAKNIFFPIIAALRISNAQKCQDFLSGRSTAYLETLYDAVDEISDVAGKWSASSGWGKSGKGKITKEKIIEIYHSLFLSENRNDNMGEIRSALKNLLYDGGNF